ncbi:MAG: RluA family pseudouridine synthase [Gammaproteobacteria bacterium]|nr:RluA family pseudouridine synthase [Gammaproteobacteria bacterium]
MPDKSLSYRKSLQIMKSEAGERLDRVLAQHFSDVSRSQLTKWIKDGSVTVDGESRKPNHRLTGGESIEISGAFQPKQDWDTATELELHIIFQDDDILVIDKPAGLVVHPGAATVAPTLANGLLALRPELNRLPRAGIVHRLDKDTTGLLVVAASELARVRLIAALAKRQVSRSYLAVVEGQLASAREIDLPLGRSSRDRTRQTVRKDGREALTLLTPLAVFRAHTLVRAELRTGRTHQIRVHAARTGLPLVGDLKYGAKRVVPPSASPGLSKLLRGIPRQALHAQQLAFEHPRTSQSLSFEAALPHDLRSLLEALHHDHEEHA